MYVTHSNRPLHGNCGLMQGKMINFAGNKTIDVYMSYFTKLYVILPCKSAVPQLP